MKNRYNLYLNSLLKPFKKLSKIEFLQPDNSVAFSLDNNYKRGYNGKYDSRAFIQGGTLNVSLQNGQRRTAGITLSNLDGAFDYSVNKIWYGTKVRLSMGLVLPNGESFYIPQGVFYFNNPQKVHNPNSEQMSYSLVDKWAYLDGTLFGQFPQSMIVEEGKNFFQATQDLLWLSRLDMENTTDDPLHQLDSTPPVVTDYYNNKPDKQYKYFKPDGTTEIRTVKATNTPWEITTPIGNTVADTLLEINNMAVGLIGYDPTGALRIDSAQASLLDTQKPLLWHFTPENSVFCGLTEVAKNTDIYNSVLITGEGMSENSFIYARVTNIDPASDTNVNMMGLRTFVEQRADFWEAEQCKDMAEYMLKQKTILQKSISIRSSQMFHLLENNLISVKRTDKQGAPVENHLIQSFSIPIGETGEMTVNATSVNDLSFETQVETSDTQTEEQNG